MNNNIEIGQLYKNRKYDIYALVKGISQIDYKRIYYIIYASGAEWNGSEERLQYDDFIVFYVPIS